MLVPKRDLPLGSATRQHRSSQRDLAYGVLRRSILLGKTKHGTRINERVVAEKLGISRVPVREALLCLHGEGLVQRSRRGLEVTRLSPEHVAYQAEFRAIIECAAARLACERIAADQVEQLRRLIDQQEILSCSDDLEAFIESDLAFHQGILAATGNPFLSRIAATMAMGAHFTGRSNARTVENHRQILDAIAAGQADRAAELMHAHVTSADPPPDDEESPANLKSEIS